MEKATIYTLLSRYFSDECTPDEINFIRDWCNRSEDNKREFVQLQKAWTLSGNEEHDILSSSRSNVWERVQTNISKKVPRLYTKRSIVYYASASAAAVLILLFGIHLFMFGDLWNTSADYTSFYVSKGEKGQILLADGTKVWLNADSKLTLSNGFNGKNRTVILEGEAYFDVKKSDKHKFIVQTSSVDIQVFGTAFSVDAYPESENVAVALLHGSVGVYKSGTNEQLISLEPSQHVLVNKNSYQSTLSVLEGDSDIAWTFEQLIFDHTSYQEVFSKMGNWYGVNISIASPPKRKDLDYRFKVKSESLREILELINKITPIEYNIDGKEVIISYK